MLKTSFLLTRALFRVLCLGVSISMFRLCVKWMETVLQLVVLVAAIVIEFSRAWIILRISIGCVHLSVVIGMAVHIGRYCYR